jgi:hypothetical protein
VVDDTGSPSYQVQSRRNAVEESAEASGIMTPIDTMALRVMDSTQDPTSGRQITNIGNTIGYAPRSDRIGKAATPANAQGIFPPDALIFVAK